MIVYMNKDYSGHFTVNVFVCASNTDNIGILAYSRGPMHDVYHSVENNKEF